MPPTADINRIAFINLSGQLSTIAPDGADLRTLTLRGRSFQFPAWSPTNQAIAVTSATAHDAGIYVVQDVPAPAPSPVRDLYHSRSQPPIYLCWSPDGNLISFLATHPIYHLALYLVRVDATSPVVNNKPVVAGQPCFWSWQPNSRGAVAHIELGQENARIVLVAVNGATGLTNTQDISIRPGYFQAPGYSVDGQNLAYASSQNVQGMESLLMVETPKSIHTVAAYTGIAAFNWSPTQAQLAYISPRSAAQHSYGPLRVWDMETATTQLLADERVIAFFWSPTGERIAYLTVAAFPHDPDEPTNQPYTNGHAKGHLPLVQLERPRQTLQLGLHVVEITTLQQRTLFTFQPTPAFVNQFIPFFDQYAYSHSLWSPDGTALIVSAMVDDSPVIYHVSLKDGATKPLAQGSMATWSWRKPK